MGASAKAQAFFRHCFCVPKIASPVVAIGYVHLTLYQTVPNCTVLSKFVNFSLVLCGFSAVSHGFGEGIDCLGKDACELFAVLLSSSLARLRPAETGMRRARPRTAKSRTAKSKGADSHRAHRRRRRA